MLDAILLSMESINMPHPIPAWDRPVTNTQRAWKSQGDLAASYRPERLHQWLLLVRSLHETYECPVDVIVDEVLDLWR